MNSTLNYKLLKLTNGENIVCTTDDNCENLLSKTSIVVCDVVVVSPVRMASGSKIIETFVMTPWISYAEKDIFEIPTNHIILATDLHEGFRNNYISFIEERAEHEQVKEQLNTEESSSIKEGLLNQIMDVLEKRKDNEESQEIEEFTEYYNRGRRTLH